MPQNYKTAIFETEIESLAGDVLHFCVFYLLDKERFVSCVKLYVQFNEHFEPLGIKQSNGDRHSI